jgi:hypothetical protein
VDHKELVQALRKLESSVQLSKIEQSQKDLPDVCKNIVSLGQRIIKQEWDKAVTIE